ncbi:glycosyltransferase family A protein [Wenyingzhuangia aestuarii]|uniref:glycosyltransferase family A protein n=1 Tax=Wenyingzhuangia aestuarii TaxID=1647582 RepID=UPI00143CB703|nr:glycosyltransferase family A protein [Wenyingzhuangia aestuarii]NJB81737.1 hypothetical protein [Wenyingzhuangia aestuarii]
MRKGENISKDVLIETSESSHRVIIPLYIPNEEEYYKEAYKIFEICLFSILKTSTSILKVSVISNGSCNSVNQKLLKLQVEDYIDELIIEKESIGKINSILKVLRTAEERLITITDADVLFCNGWEDAVVNVFEAFPKAGAVCPVPVFRKHLSLTSNIWLRYMFSKRLYFRPVKNSKALTRFANSIGWPWLDEKWKDVIGTIQAKNGTIAVLGCSHFVATYKKEVFEKLPRKNSIYKLGGDSEFKYTDQPVLKKGGYRLSTYDNYAYHIGNKLDNFILEEYKKLKMNSNKINEDYSTLTKLKNNSVEYFISEFIIQKIFYFRIIKKMIFRNKGLSEHQYRNFTT